MIFEHPDNVNQRRWPPTFSNPHKRALLHLLSEDTIVHQDLVGSIKE